MVASGSTLDERLIVDNPVVNYDTVAITCDYVQGATPLNTDAGTLYYEFLYDSVDGFTVNVEGTIEYALMRDKAALLTHQVGDMDDILKKIVLPKARGFSRIEGSKPPAINFIIARDPPTVPGQPGDPPAPAGAGWP